MHDTSVFDNCAEAYIDWDVKDDNHTEDVCNDFKVIRELGFWVGWFSLCW